MITENLQNCSENKTCKLCMLGNGPYADSVAPDMPSHLRSLIWELHCPLICKNGLQLLVSRQCAPQIRLQMCRLTLSLAVCIWHMTNVPHSGQKVEGRWWKEATNLLMQQSTLTSMLEHSTFSVLVSHDDIWKLQTCSVWHCFKWKLRKRYRTEYYLQHYKKGFWL